MGDKILGSITELIESRGYLLEFQKVQILEDLQFVPTDTEQMEKIIDHIFYKLFGKGWNDLTTTEQREIAEAWIRK